MHAGGDLRPAGARRPVGSRPRRFLSGEAGCGAFVTGFLWRFLTRFRTEEEALAVANASSFGLAGEST